MCSGSVSARSIPHQKKLDGSICDSVNNTLAPGNSRGACAAKRRHTATRAGTSASSSITPPSVLPSILNAISLSNSKIWMAISPRRRTDGRANKTISTSGVATHEYRRFRYWLLPFTLVRSTSAAPWYINSSSSR
jgi:hypothetical protein